ncbi:MAG: NUDIX domain-containing protein [Candidatus Woesebacteria bacterium]
MKLLEVINPEAVSESDVKEYPVRETARAVVIDDNGLIALLYVASDNYYKIPGGGIEAGEDRRVALYRECMEEIGCTVEILDEIGSIIEYRKLFTLKQISYCYVAKVKGKKGKPDFTPKEIAEGFKQIWMPYSEALALISKNQATNQEGKSYIVPRDLTFLQAAQRFFES